MMITIATDGSCIGNPGPGAYAFYADLGDGDAVRRAIPVPATTVGEMEVRGLLEALLFVTEFIDADPAPVTIQCDSQYVVNGYNQWMAGWKAKGWHKKGGLAHAELWKQIDATKARLQSPVTVTWVAAHQNTDSLNDKVDALANSCARSQQAVNAPALQATPVASTVSAASQSVSLSEEPAVTELVRLLKLARDTIDHLSSPDDTDARQISLEIGNALERY